MNIHRPEYDNKGLRWARCTHCGMGWIEGEKSVELIPGTGEFTTAGERPHECPESYSRATAETLLAFYTKTGVPVNQRTKARIQLGLNQ